MTTVTLVVGYDDGTTTSYQQDVKDPTHAGIAMLAIAGRFLLIHPVQADRVSEAVRMARQLADLVTPSDEQPGDTNRWKPLKTTQENP